MSQCPELNQKSGNCDNCEFQEIEEDYKGHRYFSCHKQKASFVDENITGDKNEH